MQGFCTLDSHRMRHALHPVNGELHQNEGTTQASPAVQSKRHNKIVFRRLRLRHVALRHVL